MPGKRKHQNEQDVNLGKRPQNLSEDPSRGPGRTRANPPKHEIVRIVSAALARVSESHGGKPPRRRAGSAGGAAGGACRESSNKLTRECSCSTTTLTRKSVTCHAFKV